MGNQINSNTPIGKTLYSICYGQHIILQTQRQIQNLTQKNSNNKNKNTFICTKQYQFQIDQQKISFLNLVSLIKSINIPTVVQILNLQQNQKGILVAFQYYQYTLRDQILIRSQSQNYFNEIQILAFIDCVLSALMAFQFKAINFLDLRPQRIVISKQKLDKDQKFDKDSQNKNILSLYKLALPLLFNNKMMNQQFNSLSLSQKKLSKFYYISPQLLQQIENPQNSGFSLQKNDIFSLGMIILQMMTLSPQNDCYNYQKYKIKSKQIYKKLYNCRSRYSQQFLLLVQSMLIDNSKIRANFTLIYEKMEFLIKKNKNDYNNQYKNKQSFRQSRNNYSILRNQSSQKNQFSNSKFVQSRFQTGKKSNNINSSINQINYFSNSKDKLKNVILYGSGTKTIKKSAMVQSQYLLNQICISKQAQQQWKLFNERNSLV